MPMSLCQFAETAALVSSRANLIVDRAAGLPDARLQEYWQACRGRSNDWIRTLDTAESYFGSEPSSSHLEYWLRIEPVVNEVFVTELLTRIWAAVMLANDQVQHRNFAGPIARHTVSAHIEARMKAMSLLVAGPNIAISELARADRLRRKAERWTDLLLGHFVTKYHCNELAFDVARSVDFAESQVQQIVRSTDEPVWEFVLTGLRLAFRDHAQCFETSTKWNTRIIKSVIGTFPTDIFNEFGQPKTVMRLRTERGALLDVGHPSDSKPEPKSDRSSRISFAELRQKRPLSDE